MPGVSGQYEVMRSAEAIARAVGSKGRPETGSVATNAERRQVKRWTVEVLEDLGFLAEEEEE